MKILQVISGSYPPSEGVGSHVYSLSKELVNCGHQVTIVIRRHDIKSPKYISDSGIKVILIPILNIPFISTFLFGRDLEKRFKDCFFDIVHYHSPLVPYSNLYAKKSIVTVHSTMKVDTSFIEVISLNAILNKVMGKLLSPIFEKALVEKCNKVVIVCEKIQEELVHAYKYKDLELTYVHNGIDKKLFQDLRVERKNQILYVGRLGYRKGIPNLLKAVGRIATTIRKNNYTVILCGDGHLLKFCQDFIRKHSLGDVLKIVQESQEGVNRLYNESRYLIMNSTYETGPRTILEAIFTGTPFISTKVGVVPTIDDRDYIPIKDFSVDSVVNALETAITEIDDYAFSSFQNGLAKYKSLFDNENLTQKIVSLYEA
ncbi:glycosyltransferase family 4 protein [bacterium]|nr:glycosyltransferase family 4 protein [bacterium]